MSQIGECFFVALFGVSVQTGVIMLEYINQLRARRYSIEDAAVEGALRGSGVPELLRATRADAPVFGRERTHVDQ